MKGSFVQYLVGGVMLLFSLYQVYLKDPWECALYAVAGSAFISVGLVKDKAFPNHERMMGIISWILIIFSGLLFLFLVRTDS